MSLTPDDFLSRGINIEETERAFKKAALLSQNNAIDDSTPSYIENNFGQFHQLNYRPEIFKNYSEFNLYGYPQEYFEIYQKEKKLRVPKSYENLIPMNEINFPLTRRKNVNCIYSKTKSIIDSDDVKALNFNFFVSLINIIFEEYAQFIFIAGGFALSYLMYKSEEEIPEYGDIDFFIAIPIDIPNREQIANNIVKVFRRYTIKSRAMLLHNKNAFMFHDRIKNIFMSIQLIKKIFRSPSEIVHGFDIDCCCVIIDSVYDIRITERCYHAIKNGYNVANLERASRSYERRLAKYSDRQYPSWIPFIEYFKSVVLFDVKMSYYQRGSSILINSLIGADTIKILTDEERQNYGIAMEEYLGEKTIWIEIDPNQEINSNFNAVTYVDPLDWYPFSGNNVLKNLFDQNTTNYSEKEITLMRADIISAGFTVSDFVEFDEHDTFIKVPFIPKDNFIFRNVKKVYPSLIKDINVLMSEILLENISKIFTGPVILGGRITNAEFTDSFTKINIIAGFQESYNALAYKINYVYILIMNFFKIYRNDENAIEWIANNRTIEAIHSMFVIKFYKRGEENDTLIITEPFEDITSTSPIRKYRFKKSLIELPDPIMNLNCNIRENLMATSRCISNESNFSFEYVRSINFDDYEIITDQIPKDKIEKVGLRIEINFIFPVVPLNKIVDAYDSKKIIYYLSTPTSDQNERMGSYITTPYSYNRIKHNIYYLDEVSTEPSWTDYIPASKNDNFLPYYLGTSIRQSKIPNPDFAHDETLGNLIFNYFYNISSAYDGMLIQPFINFIQMNLNKLTKIFTTNYFTEVITKAHNEMIAAENEFKKRGYEDDFRKEEEFLETRRVKKRI